MSDTLEDRLPPELRPLARVAWNYAWSWVPDGRLLFRDLDPQLWREVEQNPLALLRRAPEERLTELAAEPEFGERLERFLARFEAASAPAANAPNPIAYFSAEFAIHESLPVYAGGLGVLAGDYLKSASDLGIPAIGIGILYRQGYFRQSFNREGWQVEDYTDVDFSELPVCLIRDAGGQPVTFTIPILVREVLVQAWEVAVGRSRLLLLDTNREENDHVDRWISGHLYGGDRDTRIRQEILLGIGGVRLLRALGIQPERYHMNEGHSAFLTLELARERVAAGETFQQAAETVRRECVFTTHTPVPAGNDVFALELVEPFFSQIWPQLGLSREEFLGLGRRHPEDQWEPFGMTPLALKMSGAANGVSKKHGEVARAMWQPLWPDRAPEQVPISSITNGVHPATWMAPPFQALLEHHLGAEWSRNIHEAAAWEGVDSIPDAELWNVHLSLKRRLIAAAREWAFQERQNRGEGGGYLEGARHLFEPDCLLLGFARRVATYKRLNLLFWDQERSLELVSRKERPVHVLLAGKAHPHDGEAKSMLQWLFQHRHDPRLFKGVAILGGYDARLARLMVQGTDGWLNLPRRPQEASGTSGMKAAMNAVLNVSVLDGWWLEGYNGRNGWAVGHEVSGSTQDQDAADAAALYDVLENEVIPLYYDRDDAGIPRGWVARMKDCLKTLGPQFSSHRMVLDYVHQLYGR